MPSARRFPPPWIVEEHNDAFFIVRDATGQALGYFYFEDEAGRRSAAKYRQGGGHKRKVMRIETAEFMRRFLLHVLPNGFHRIRHYGVLANGHRADKLALCRSLLAVPAAPADRRNGDDNDRGNPKHQPSPCPCCAGRMRIIETFDGSLCRPYPVRRPDGLQPETYYERSTHNSHADGRHDPG